MCEGVSPRNAHLGQVILASVGHGEGQRDVLPVDVLLVFHTKDLAQFGEVPSFVPRQANEQEHHATNAWFDSAAKAQHAANHTN